MNLSGRDKFKGRWEGTNFSFERDRSYGFSWPQRNYNCTFCKKEFRSAQALGGHMNVHRRDRARQLTQHSSSSSSSEINTAPHLHSNPNPKPNLNHDHKLLFPSPSTRTSSAKAPATRFLTYTGRARDFDDNVVLDQDVSPQIMEIRKKLAVEVNNRNEVVRGVVKQDKKDEARVHNKENDHELLGLDLNMASTGHDGSEDLDLELRLGSF
ncbi:hypothetical protein ACET3Z_007408 [Daucus carota]